MSMTEIDTKFQGNFDRKTLGQVVLVFQGGGALGAYQAGVYEAMQEVGLEPDWVIGTSIGAINASLIAGSPPGRRLVQLQEFWRRIEQGPFHRMAAETWGVGSLGTSALTMATGVKGFFQPNLRALVGTKTALGAESAGYYSTAPLARTLADLIDPAYLNAGKPRLTVGAANVQSGEMHYFDSRKAPLTIRHVMASGALPPAFPAIRIDGELYWDGGILSNTPIEAVFDDNPRRNGLVFTVQIWNPTGPEPDSLWKVMSRQKDLQYSSRDSSHIARQKQIHRLRHVIAEMAERLPPDMQSDPEIRELMSYGCLTRMHVVRLLAPPLAGEDHSKDIDFSPEGIGARWAAGYADTARVLAQAPWTHPCDPIEGFILHDVSKGRMINEG